MEEHNNSEERKEKFQKETAELAAKYDCDLLASPLWVPNEDGTFRLAISIQVVDVRTLPAKSPYQREDLNP